MAKETKSATRKSGRRKATTAKPIEEAVAVAAPVEEARKGFPPTLRFSSAGWCEELKRSYFIGAYVPHDWEEYDALARYADKEGTR